MNKITILGSGTSTGVPILSCKCKVCQSNEWRNKRLRTSALIQTPESKRILIDASPDLRTQLLREKIDSMDAVIITHDHADHTHGMDDLRPFSFQSQNPIPVFTDSYTAKNLRIKFPYIFERKTTFANKPILGGGIPLLDLEEISPGKKNVLNNDFEFFSLPHGHGDSMGLRHSKMAYLVDCRLIPQDTLDILRDAQLELLIIDCLRPEPHQTHLHLDLTLEYIEFIRPKLAVLTHMGHEWDYPDLLNQIERRGIKNTIPALDGQSFLYS